MDHSIRGPSLPSGLSKPAQSGGGVGRRGEVEALPRIGVEVEQFLAAVAVEDVMVAASDQRGHRPESGG